jgi:hypothetical protein
MTTTDTLRRSGVLQKGRVSNVSVESSRATVLSRITRLRLTYDGDATNSPSTLILKTGLADRVGDETWDAGRQEVAFYIDVAAAMSSPLVPCCFSDNTGAQYTPTQHLIEMQRSRMLDGLRDNMGLTWRREGCFKEFFTTEAFAAWTKAPLLKNSEAFAVTLW